MSKTHKSRIQLETSKLKRPKDPKSSAMTNTLKVLKTSKDAKKL